LGKRRFGGRRPSFQPKIKVRINERITMPEVFLVDEDGPIGKVSREEALQRARAAELDLVEVAPKERPPVCKIMDFGKYKYEMEKQQRKQRARNKGQDLKEIRLSLNISENDLLIKIRKTKEFLEKKHKVKITLRLKGREVVQYDAAKEMMDTYYNRLDGMAKVETPAKKLGRQWQMVILPDPDWSKKTATQVKNVEN